MLTLTGLQPRTVTYRAQQVAPAAKSLDKRHSLVHGQLYHVAARSSSALTDAAGLDTQHEASLSAHAQSPRHTSTSNRRQAPGPGRTTPDLIRAREQRLAAACRLTNMIQGCQDWKQLCQLITAPPAPLNHLHVAAAAGRLAHLVTSTSHHGHQQMLTSEMLQLHAFIADNLLPLLDRHLLSFSPRQLSNTAWALARLQHPPNPMWLSEWCSCVARCLDRCTPRDLAQSLWAVAVLSGQPHRSSAATQLTQQHYPDPSTSPVESDPLTSASGPESGRAHLDAGPQGGHEAAHTAVSLRWLYTLCSEVALRAPAFKLQDTSNTLWALAVLLGPGAGRPNGSAGPGTPARSAINSLLQQLQTSLQQPSTAAEGLRVPGQDVAAEPDMYACQSASSQSSSQQVHHQGLPHTSCHAAGRSQELSNVLWALASLAHHPGPDLLQLLSSCLAVEAAAHRAQPQHVAISLWACATLRFAPPQPDMAALCAAAQVFSRQQQLEHHDVAHMVWSWGALGYAPPPQLLQGLMEYVRSHMAVFTPRELVMIASGLAKLGVRPHSGMLAMMCFATARRWHQLQPHETATLLAALAHMRVRPTPAFLYLAAGAASPRNEGAPAPWKDLQHARTAPEPEDVVGRHSLNADQPETLLSSGSQLGAAPDPHQQLGEYADSTPRQEDWDAPGAELACPNPLLDGRYPGPLSKLLWALGMLGWQAPAGWLPRARAAIIRALPLFSPGELVTSLWGLSRLQRQRPSAAWSDAVLSRLCEVLPSLRTRDLVRATHSLHRLHLRASPTTQERFEGYCHRRIAVVLTRAAEVQAMQPGSSSEPREDAGAHECPAAPGVPHRSPSMSDASEGCEVSWQSRGGPVAAQDSSTGRYLVTQLCSGPEGCAADQAHALHTELLRWRQARELPRSRCGAQEVWQRRLDKARWRVEELPA